MTRALKPARGTSRCIGSHLAIALLLTVGSGCGESALWPELEAPPLPELRNDGWNVGTPESQGFEPAPVALMDHDLRTRRIAEVDALVIARNGILVYEGYYDTATGVDALHQLNSATKSVASIVVGVAVQQGLIEGYDVPVADLFPDYADVFAAEPQKMGMTLRHALTMTAGLEWDDEDVTSRDRDDVRLLSEPDAMRHILERPLVTEPGTEFHYSSACSMILTGVIPNVSGMQAGAFAEQHLFGPLGIQDFVWETTDDGTTTGFSGLYLRGRDLLKLGQLYLNGGAWEGQQIVSEDWIEASFRPWVEPSWREYGVERYGFQWWMYDHAPTGNSERPYGILMASGYGGQKLFVIPDLDLVAVFYGCTTEGYECGISDSVPEVVLYQYILRALQ
jgi:CubicO group peptidase (beta-lactamase class C family)